MPWSTSEPCQQEVGGVRRSRRVRGIWLGLGKGEVEAVDGAEGDCVDHLVRALAEIDVGEGDVEDDRRRREAAEPGVVLQHPARNRVLDQEEVADPVELGEAPAGCAGRLPCTGWGR